ncbi:MULTISPECIES: hypothetical protein [unclassified Bradyrhizobium]|uniref:hypothetical protein n=1 Tax=unclassified Bradyrhizobium TaxID=2631580 RepID=UPI0028E79C7C|nr:MULTISPECIES: hypothetical protein [unclassified Bradyrhizobium]
MPNQTLLGIIREHLPYEINMLRLTYKELEAGAKQAPAKSQVQQVYQNALIEAFCVHGRSLIGFFADKRYRDTDTVASDFVDGFVKTLNVDTEPLKSIVNQLNKQLFHLTKNRTIIDAQKFDVGRDGSLLLKLIEAEIIKFTAALQTTDFKSFKCDTSPIAVLPGLPFSSCTTAIERMKIISHGSLAP